MFKKASHIEKTIFDKFITFSNFQRVGELLTPFLTLGVEKLGCRKKHFTMEVETVYLIENTFCKYI